MPAPKGNKNAVGHGRPPNEGFSDDELITLGKELLQWLADDLIDQKTKLPKDPSILHLCEFYNIKKGIHYSQWTSICRRDCFLAYYEKARETMGYYVLKNGEFAQSYGNRFLNMYFRDLRQHEKEILTDKVEIEERAKAKFSAANNVPMNDEILKLKDELNTVKYQLQKEREKNGSVAQTAEVLQRVESPI